MLFFIKPNVLCAFNLGLIPSTPPSGRRLDPIPNPPQPRLDASGAPISLNQSDRVLPDHLPDDVLLSLTRPEDITDRLHPVRRSMSVTVNSHYKFLTRCILDSNN